MMTSGSPGTRRIPVRSRPSTASTAILRADGRDAVLIKRTERQARRGNLAAALGHHSGGSIDRRIFLQRAGIVAGALAGLGALPLTGVRKAQAGPPPVAGSPVTVRKNVCTHCSVGCTV